MARREILMVGDPMLRERSEEITEFSVKLWRLLDDMYDTMTDADGVGLAAVQVGVLKRAIVIEDNDKGRIELINPVIVSMRGRQTEKEGCLSFPKKYGIVNRPAKVRVRAFNRYGMPVEYKARELLARAFCHEIDHLNGILFADKVIEWVKKEDED